MAITLALAFLLDCLFGTSFTHAQEREQCGKALHASFNRCLLLQEGRSEYKYEIENINDRNISDAGWYHVKEHSKGHHRRIGAAARCTISQLIDFGEWCIFKDIAVSGGYNRCPRTASRLTGSGLRHKDMYGTGSYKLAEYTLPSADCQFLTLQQALTVVDKHLRAVGKHEILFIGDSLSAQQAVALECELECLVPGFNFNSTPIGRFKMDDTMNDLPVDQQTHAFRSIDTLTVYSRSDLTLRSEDQLRCSPECSINSSFLREQNLRPFGGCIDCDETGITSPYLSLDALLKLGRNTTVIQQAWDFVLQHELPNADKSAASQENFLDCGDDITLTPPIWWAGFIHAGTGVVVLNSGAWYREALGVQNFQCAYNITLRKVARYAEYFIQEQGTLILWIAIPHHSPVTNFWHPNNHYAEWNLWAREILEPAGVIVVDLNPVMWRRWEVDPGVSHDGFHWRNPGPGSIPSFINRVIMHLVAAHFLQTISPSTREDLR